LNDSKWRRIEKDLPKCSVIGRRSMMSQFTVRGMRFLKTVKKVDWKISLLYKYQCLEVERGVET
jgi:hypothetical protein